MQGVTGRSAGIIGAGEFMVPVPRGHRATACADGEMLSLRLGSPVASGHWGLNPGLHRTHPTKLTLPPGALYSRIALLYRWRRIIAT